jgi:hypothetical protein
MSVTLNDKVTSTLFIDSFFMYFAVKLSQPLSNTYFFVFVFVISFLKSETVSQSELTSELERARTRARTLKNCSASQKKIEGSLEVKK